MVSKKRITCPKQVSIFRFGNLGFPMVFMPLFYDSSVKHYLVQPLILDSLPQADQVAERRQSLTAADAFNFQVRRGTIKRGSIMKVLSLEQLLGATLSTNHMLALQQSQLVPLRFPPSGQFACFAPLGFVPTGSCGTFLRSDWLFWLLRFLRFLFCGTQSRGVLKS